jgi:hypothetical protein
MTAKPDPELLPDGSILAAIPDGESATGYKVVRLVPGEREHAEWLALIQKEGVKQGPAKPDPELLPDGSILVAISDTASETGHTTVRLEPGEPEHAEWLALIQKERGAQRPAARGGGGFAFWNGEVFVGFGALGLIVAAVLFFTDSGPFKGEANEPCIVTATANKLCGDDARAWCNTTDDLRDLDPAGSSKSQAVCDDIRHE